MCWPRRHVGQCHWQRCALCQVLVERRGEQVIASTRTLERTVTVGPLGQRSLAAPAEFWTFAKREIRGYRGSCNSATPSFVRSLARTVVRSFVPLMVRWLVLFRVYPFEGSGMLCLA